MFDGVSALSEVGIGERHIVRALMVALLVVVFDDRRAAFRARAATPRDL
jgi:hypothetical protein